jgi:hypothetical protein
MVGGTWGLIQPWGSGNPRGSFAFMLFWGFIVLGMGLMAFVVVVRHVDQLEDGSFRFRSRLRSLVVRPDQIISMVGLPWYLDLYGSYPFRMNTPHGAILVDRHMLGGLDLETTLRQANPELKIKRAWELGPRLSGRPQPGVRTSGSDISNIGPR